ncbi:MAG TPA: tRNA 2-selenouridine(34) synthase MnmH [Alcanivorax sp.]|jgi:tRNA 2-selenouridine synthase|uniref:tRNA 2-selenouridine(34) synthase MnmH n=1 Tax=Alcanivorax TaxID=59753 RepID=UPI000C4947E7|nr:MULTISPECIES: tRNA 2-selenouridine(34) synthase MnmH [Alcanivorax]MAC14186.1 tRNA 2-selenouridine(34) synthase MnmH [Alcanivorax sp.]MBG31847.1 tRNA 2-selenouridine(34) synthase MnmH [Alcanivorax sp.]MDF1637225.1 tRNA 2-selenouridine(34) synthase MnmH [Alcanivorax jadensis]HBC19776.1 tRNA 2-selenouridine(34) synthase MnmH [Alcanivorax sp.]|tara:strand:- start:12804 stop:13907 length:1104 start_codon:yes stop_codon:yes gene_type:complete
MRNDTDDFLSLFLNGTPLLDVRAPVEFAKGAFTGAANIALINDDERHQIGICYKQHGQQAAIDLGNELVSGTEREQRMQAWQQWWQANPNGYLYCFRGGLRSQTTQAWLREAGIDAPLVTGGYKAMRRFLLDEMEACIAALPFEILCGRTGCAKTRVIESQTNAVDLEGLAHHRGSSFGRRPGGQPTQIDFDNALAIAMLKQRAQSPARVLLEDESKLIGRCHLPFSLQDKISTCPRIIINETLESRVQVTLEDYVVGPLEEYRQHFGEKQALHYLGEELLAAMDRIRRRLGGLRHQQLRQQLSEALAVQAISGDTGLHEDWIRTLLSDYYDPMYDYMLSRREGDIVFEGSRNEVMAFLEERQTPDA